MWKMGPLGPWVHCSYRKESIHVVILKLYKYIGFPNSYGVPQTFTIDTITTNGKINIHRKGYMGLQDDKVC